MIPTKIQSEKIQILRGLSILSVVLIHALPTTDHRDILYRPFINFGVAMFIFLSGLLTNSQKLAYLSPVAIRSFFARRCRRILPPYLFWSVIYTIYYGRYEDFLPRLLTGRCCGIYYYLFVYMQFVLLTPLLSWMIHRASHRKCAVLFLLFLSPAAIIAEYLLAFRGIYLIFPWNINHFPVWITFYVSGLLLGNLEHPLPSERNSIKCAFLSILFLFLEMVEGLLWLSFGREDIATSQTKISDFCLSLLIILCAYTWLMRKPENSLKKAKHPFFTLAHRLFLTLGNWSFAIYLIHPLFLSLLRAL